MTAAVERSFQFLFLFGIRLKQLGYFILSNLPMFSVGVLLVLCVAFPRKNLSQSASFGGCGFVYALFRLK
jgi:hypothetical protein